MAEPETDELPIFEPLTVKCTESHCESDRHCFKPKGGKEKTKPGACRECGKQLVDFERTTKRDLNDIEHTFSNLQHELIRHVFFHADFDERSMHLARKRGLAGVLKFVPGRTRSKLRRYNNVFDSRQTPKGFDIIHFGMHATATCCRACVEYWHGIPKEDDLTDDELAYLSGLVAKYIELRWPDMERQLKAASE